MFKDFSTSDKTTGKDKDKDRNKTEDKNMLDKINNKIDIINELNNGLTK